MQSGKTTIIPTLRYRDVAAAIEWLCSAFGFTKHNVFRDEGGSIVHSQLVLPKSEGHGMIMVSPVRAKPVRDQHEFDRYQGPAAERATQSAYVVVADAERHHERASQAGAKVVLPVSDQHGGKLYSCLDLEGHLWNFGTYDPWASSTEDAAK